MKNILLVLMVLGTFVATAQENIYLRGFTYDKDAGNVPLGSAAIQIKNTQLGGLSEDNGYFEIPIPKVNLKDSVKVSFVGYQTQTISVANYKEGDTLRIYVASAIETKQEAVITSYNARGVLLKAIDNLRKNLYVDSIIQTGFYRQYHKENGKYVRLLEADVSIAFNVKSIYKYSFHELMQVNKQRRSENYERNVDAMNHGDHLADLLKENPFSYNKGTFMNPKMIDFFAPKFESEDSVQYVIKTQYKESSSAKLEQARVWVEKETFAILRIEVQKFPNPYYTKSRYANTSIWQLVNETDIIELEKVNGKLFVSALSRTYNHHVVNPRTGSVDFIVEET
ncbi:MAG TPA: carboxypeptidase-like regulatory domain-containing protein, partial [Chitinophagales bacterium]|nr:carboxypeptidase-like regulatory domain-containing protein [Chitinophagales bacterium]